MAWIVVFLIVALAVNVLINRIPRTGRAGITKGIRVDAVITNKCKNGLGTKTMRLTGNGRKFKVKLKADEAHLWRKGDSVSVLISNENKRIYRVLFFDYFHENEERLRALSLDMLKSKIKSNGISAKALKYTEETYTNVESSSADSRTVYMLYSYMKLLESYIVLSVAFCVFAVLAKVLLRLSMTQMLIPIAVLGILLWYIYSVITTCGRIMKKL